MPPVKSVHRIVAKNFRSLASVDVQLAPFTVLAGPNGSGKSNLLNVLRFLATTVRFDLDAALQQWGGLSTFNDRAPALGPSRWRSTERSRSTRVLAPPMSTDWSFDALRPDISPGPRRSPSSDGRDAGDESWSRAARRLSQS